MTEPNPETVRATASILAFILEDRPDEARHLIALMDVNELRESVYGAGQMFISLADHMGTTMHTVGILQFDSAAYKQTLAADLRALANGT